MEGEEASEARTACQYGSFLLFMCDVDATEDFIHITLFSLSLSTYDSFRLERCLWHVVTPLMLDGTYLSRNIATLGPYSLPATV